MNDLITCLAAGIVLFARTTAQKPTNAQQRMLGSCIGAPLAAKAVVVIAAVASKVVIATLMTPSLPGPHCSPDGFNKSIMRANMGLIAK